MKQIKGKLVSKIVLFSAAVMIVLTGCKSTPKTTANVGPIMMGPSMQNSLGTTKRTYTYDSDLYMDVVIPVFNPGLPVANDGSVDYDEVEERGIWPQLRRAEAKRFAVQTKKALEKIGTFGSISVVPSPNASGDVFVLGTINESNSELIEITATIIDATGTVWGQKNFENKVSKGFFRDAMNKDKNPYGKVFKDIGDYVYDTLKAKSEQEKTRIKNLANVRYAQMYSPEAFGQFVSTKVGTSKNIETYLHTLNGMPSEENKMFSRIETLKTQDQLFVDNLQEEYLAFDENTKESYRTWQRETLPEAVAAREAEEERNTSAIIGTGLAVLGVLLNSNSNSLEGELGTLAAGLGAAYFVKDAMNKNAELKVHKASLDEIGENLDITLTPTVMEFNDEVVELTGTAGEQFEQWRAHLKKIYDLEYSQTSI